MALSDQLIMKTAAKCIRFEEIFLYLLSVLLGKTEKTHGHYLTIYLQQDVQLRHFSPELGTRLSGHVQPSLPLYSVDNLLYCGNLYL